MEIFDTLSFMWWSKVNTAGYTHTIILTTICLGPGVLYLHHIISFADHPLVGLPQIEENTSLEEGKRLERWSELSNPFISWEQIRDRHN